MPTALLIITSILAIIISILSVQVPRYLEHRETSARGWNHASTRPMTDGTNTPTPPPTPSRKPWDPPFPKAPKQTSKESNWHFLPPSLARKGHASSEGSKETRNDRVEGTEDGDELRSGQEQESGSIMAVVWPIIAVLAGMLLVLLFALLIAHCLAWFVVYKTEARLGEARRGLVQGGEMRLCLCARG